MEEKGGKTKKGRERKMLLSLILPGLFGGVLNGLFGCGGGVAAMLALSKYMPGDKEDGERVRRIFATTVLSVIPMSLASAPVYGTFGAVSADRVLPILLPALIGGAAGGLLLSRINTGLLKKIFAALLIWSGVRLMM